MSLYRLKSQFQRLLQPCCDYLHQGGIKPNHVTVSAIALSCFGGAIVYCAQYSLLYLWLIPALLFIRMALNAIDGMLARQYNETSKLGALLNEMGDVIADTVFYLPFVYLLTGSQAVMLVSLVILGIFIEMLGVLAQTIGSNRRYDGPFGKSDRAAFFGLLSITFACGYAESTAFQFLLFCGLILSFLTLKNRAQNALIEAN